MNPITYEGKDYNNIYDLACSLNISYSKLHYRLNTSLSVEDAVERVLEEEMGDNKLRIYGKIFKDTKDVASYFGVSLLKLNRRVNDLSMPLSEAIEELYQQSLELKGVKYQSFTDLCCAHNKFPETVFNSIKRGQSLHSALTYIPRQNKREVIFFKGENYSSKKAVCDEVGVLISTVSWVAKRENLEWLDALTVISKYLDTLKGDRPNILNNIPAVIYNNVWFYTLGDFCLSCGVVLSDYLAFKGNHNYSNYIDIMQAMKDKQRVYYRYKDKKDIYPSMSELSDANGKFNIAKENALGNIKRVSMPKYPNCTYNPVSYTKDTRKDFARYLETLRTSDKELQHNQ